MKAFSIFNRYTGSALIVLFLSGCGGFDGHFSQAEKSFEKENYVDAIDHLNVAIAEWKSSDGTEKKAKAYELLGRSYHKIKKLENAIDSYEKAVALSDHVFDAAYELGLLYFGTKKYAQAERIFQKALLMKKDDPMALVGLGDSYFLSRQYVKARDTYNRVLDISPGVRLALTNLHIVNQKLAPRKKRRSR